MTDGEWMEVAREFREASIVGVPTVEILARAMAMVAEETRKSPREHKSHCSYMGQDAPCRCGYRRTTDAQIIAGLRARLKSEKGT